MATSSGLFLATIYNQSQLAERKHVARYWSINTAATAVPLSAHYSPLVITTKIAAAILDGGLFGGGVLPAQYCCPCGSNPFSGLWAIGFTRFLWSSLSDLDLWPSDLLEVISVTWPCGWLILSWLVSFIHSGDTKMRKWTSALTQRLTDRRRRWQPGCSTPPVLIGGRGIKQRADNLVDCADNRTVHPSQSVNCTRLVFHSCHRPLPQAAVPLRPCPAKRGPAPVMK